MASKISCADDGAPEQRIFWASATSLFSLALTAGMAILRSFGLRRATKRRRPPAALKDADVKPVRFLEVLQTDACTTRTLVVSW
jgi:hypothetical protein